jgi:large subunit ribosomal protein L1
MAKHGKKYRANTQLVDPLKVYQLDEAIDTIKKMSSCNFDESIEIAYNLNIDPRQSGQTVRGATVLPHGTGKQVRVVVVASGDAATAAEEAGADEVGASDLIEKIRGGWLEFDALIATPDTMKDLRTLGKVLGPRGLMPNPKTGTLTEDTAAAVKEAKAGRVEYRNDKDGCIRLAFGKKSFSKEQLVENAKAINSVIMDAKPEGIKGNFCLGISIASTMSPGLKVDFKDA